MQELKDPWISSCSAPSIHVSRWRAPQCNSQCTLTGMVDLESLAAFDCLQWLRTGDSAAQLLGCSQSTVSRSTKRCQEAFGVRLVKRAAEWHVQGDGTLLNAERRVHQLHRWSADLPLRLDCQHWLRHVYGELDLAGWVTGNLNYLEYERPLQLLRERVIDAWICSAPDHPQEPDLVAVRLCSMPSLLVARASHPLLRHGASLPLEAATRYPLLPLPAQAFPVFQKVLEDLGFHSDFRGLPALATELGHDPQAAEDLALGVASPLTLPLYGDDWRPLPLTLPVSVGDVVMLRADLASHPRAEALIHALAMRLDSLAALGAQMEVLVDVAAERLPAPDRGVAGGAT